MKITLNALKIFIDFDPLRLNLDKNNNLNSLIEDTLNSLGHEVDDVLDASTDFIVVKIIDIKKHSNAEKLNICTVSDGKNLYEIICGASNVYVNMITVMAPIGAYIPSGGFIIKKAKIRGVESTGMLCAASELMLADKSLYNNGILDLKGYNIGDVFLRGDVVFTLSITPNRGDCLSVYGIAHELAIRSLGRMKPLSQPNLKLTKRSIIKNNAARKAYFAHIENLDIDRFDEEMNSIMRFAGIKDISYPVNVTNYVSYLFGQPLHVYNAKNVKGDLIITKGVLNSFSALDNQKYDLIENDIVIIDQDGQIQSLAGIMGGAVAMYNDEKSIILEAALFYDIDIRKTGSRLKIQSEARKKYERFVSSHLIEYALSYAISMLNGKLEVIYYDNVKDDDIVQIKIDENYINKICGFDICNMHLISILAIANFKLDNRIVYVPNRRAKEIQTNQDLAFELLRILSYDNIPILPLQMQLKSYSDDDVVNLTNKAANQKYSEVRNFCFIEDKKNTESYLQVVNDIANKKYMRSSMLCQMIDNIDKNKYNFIISESIRQFEFGYIFGKEGLEYEVLTLMLYGNNKRFLKQSEQYGFYDLKEDVQAILSDFKFKFTDKCNNNFIKLKAQQYHYYNYIEVDGKTVGIMGRVSLDLTYDNLFFAEIFAENLKYVKSKKEEDNNHYPVVVRDFCFSTKGKDIGQLISQVLKVLYVKNVVIYDIYEETVTLKVYIQSDAKVLSGDEIEEVYNNIVNIFKKELIYIKQGKLLS